MVEHYERIQNLGYSHHNRGVGLGFGGMHAAAPPASLLRQCAQVGDRRQKPPPQPAAGSEAATYERWQRQLQQPQPQPTFSPLTRYATPTPAARAEPAASSRTEPAPAAPAAVVEQWASTVGD